MKRNHLLLVFFLVGLGACLFAAPAVADTFGSGANTFQVDFVTIGNPGNPADTTGMPNPAGSVPYEYRIGKYEISEQMIDKANAQSGADGAPLGITKDTRGPNKPATSMSWFEAARFVNWLNMSTRGVPAYKFDASGNFQLWQPIDPGYDPNNLFRNKLATYFLPSADEWYKAAFYDPVAGHYWDYPTGSDAPPISVVSGTAIGTAVWNRLHEEGPADVMFAGGQSPYGTVGQAGNVWEWEETARDLVNDAPGAVRGARGGDWNPSLSTVDLSSEYRSYLISDGNPFNGGFRVASIPIPEPLSIRLMACGIGTLLVRRPSGWSR